MIEGKTSRRQAIQWLGASAISCFAMDARARGRPADHHHRHRTFWDDRPDPEATAKFYGRIFDGQLFQEKDPPPRFYVKFGTGYLAFGGKPDAVPSIDHFCALIENYQPAEMRKSLEAANVPLGAGPFGMATDPDGLRCNSCAPRPAWPKPSSPLTGSLRQKRSFRWWRRSRDAACVGFGSFGGTLSKLFGAPLSRSKKPERVWFGAAKTKLGLELVAAGESRASTTSACVSRVLRRRRLPRN